MGNTELTEAQKAILRSASPSFDDTPYTPDPMQLAMLAKQEGLSGQLSQLVELCVATAEEVHAMAAQLAEMKVIFEQFSQVNPQELMQLMSGMMGGGS